MPGTLSTVRRRPHLTELGFNRLGILLFGLNGLVLVADVVLFPWTGLSIAWTTELSVLVVLLAFCGVWFNFYLTPSRQEEWFVGEVVFIVALILFLSNVASPLQYAAIAVGFPYCDWWLAAADAAIGINVGSLAAWTFAHPAFAGILHVAYDTLLPQFVLAILLLAVSRERERLWEFAFHFHVCAIVTVALLVLFPAVCPPAYYGFRPTIDMTHLIGQIKGLHEGTLKVVRFEELEGLVSFPSFHAAGAMIVTWAVRDRRWVFVPIACLNVLLLASTFVTGVHYVIDVIATVPMIVASVAIYNRYCARWLEMPVAMLPAGNRQEHVVPADLLRIR